MEGPSEMALEGIQMPVVQQIWISSFPTNCIHLWE